VKLSPQIGEGHGKTSMGCPASLLWRIEDMSEAELIVDPKEIVEDIYKTTMNIAWRFDYENSNQKVEDLYNRAKQNQWDAMEILDWDHEVDPSKPLIGGADSAYSKMSFFKKLSKSQQEKFTAHTTAQLLSQFLHGEQGALMTAATVTHSVPDSGAKLYAATQTIDEARHVEVYAKYCKKIAMTYPMSPWLKALIDITLQSDKYQKVMIGMNMIVEGLALGAFNNMYRTTSCPLLKDITFNVMRDESRHVSFGHAFLGPVFKTMHPDDVEECAEFTFTAIQHLLTSTAGGTGASDTDPGFLMVLENCEIDHKDFFASVKEAADEGSIEDAPPPGQIHSVKDLMMPAISRVGLITPGVRHKYEEAGIPIWEDTTILNAMEDGKSDEAVLKDIVAAAE
jgi:hypothetical protein